jgi:GNAT superfamily N-acetyltransferase
LVTCRRIIVRIDTIVRKAELKDADVIADFNILLASETEDMRLDPARVRAGVEALLRDPNKGTYYVAETVETVVGQVLITYEWSDWRNGNFWWLQSVYIDKPARGQGIFKSLYAHVVTEAKKAGNVCGMRLYVEAHNVSAQKSYLSLGLNKSNYQLFERVF